MTMPVTLDGRSDVSDPTNDANDDILFEAPYVVEVRIEGVAPFLFHRWSDDAVAEKAAAKKGSAAKKTDNLESYVYRDGDDNISIPGTYLVGSLTDARNGAAKYIQDPRSPRKSALDLFKAGVIPVTAFAPIIPAGSTEPTKDWEFVDRRRVTVQRQAITRHRPGWFEGWSATFQVLCTTPEYISPKLLRETLMRAGQLVGIGDFRPTFGRFAIVSWREGLEA